MCFNLCHDGKSVRDVSLSELRWLALIRNYLGAYLVSYSKWKIIKHAEMNR